MVLIVLLIFLITDVVFAQIEIKPQEFYPGSLHIFKGNGDLLIINAGEKKYKFPVKSKIAFFAIPYGSKKIVILDVISEKRVIYRKYLKILPKHFRVSKITVKERKKTKKILKRIYKEYKLLRKILKRYTYKKFKERYFIKPVKSIKISTPFGAKRIINGKKKSVHWGVDFSAPEGTPVYATLSGKVVLSRNLYYTGNTVIIDHGLGLYSLYAHLSKMNVKEGQFISGGRKIGEVGSTGRSTGPHLHFGIYINGIRVDPILALKLKLPD